MADIRIVAEVVGANKVNALVNSTKKLEGQVKNLGNAYLSGKIGPEQFNKGLTELRKSANALYPTHQKASAVVTKLARDYVTLTQAQQQDIAATKAYIQARREATAMNQRFNQEKKLEELRVKQATQTLNTYTVASRASSVAQQAATKGNSQLGVVVQQTGYQVGDFLVQIQSGTNPMVAFGQQATQLVGVLPLMAGSLGMTAAAAIGLSTALGIGIPLLTAIGAAFLRSRESANKASDGVKTFEDRLKSARDEIGNMKQALEILRGGFEGVFDLTLTQEIAKARSELRQAQREVNAEASRATEALKLQSAALGNLTEEQVNAMAEAAMAASPVLQKARERLALAEKELAIFEATAREIRERERDESVRLQLAEARNILAEQMVDSQETLKEGAQGFLNIWTAITGQIKESSASMQAAQRAIEVGRVADQYAQYGAGRAAFEGIVQGGLGDTTGGVKPPSTPSSRQQGGAIKDPLPELLKRLALDERLLGVSKEREAVERAIADSDVTYSQASIDAAVKRLEAYNLEKQALEEVAATQEKIANTIENSMESALMSMVDGTKSVKDAFKSMAADIIKELYRVLVVQQIVNSAKTAMGGFFADGAAFSGGRVTPFANGGVVGGPTYFPMAGGKTGLMGEAGPEAIMPLKRGSDGKLGVSVEGGSGSVVVNNNINVSGGSDPAAIRMEVAKLMPQITSATKSAVIDARRRGGQMKAAFG